MLNNIFNIAFTPYDKVIIGSNVVSCKYLINIKDFHPIIIGKGDIPHIWLYILTRGNIISLVDDNRESYDKVKVSIDKTKKIVSVVLKNNPGVDFVILLADFVNEGVFNIRKMDLTPMGLSVISDEKELVVGNNHLSGNVVIGAESFIALSDK